MPFQDHRTGYTGTYIHSTNKNAVPLNAAFPRTFGTYKSISSLNNTGVFIPGTYKANPVVIQRSSSTESSIISVDFTYQYGIYTYYVKFQGDWAACLGLYAGVIPRGVTVSWDASLANGSLNKAYAKLAEPEYDLGVTLGELRETLEGLANPLSALRKYIEQMKKLNVITVKAWQRNKHALITRKRNHYALSMLGGSWLEWRMAVMPLLKSIEDLIEHLTTASVALDDRLRRTKASLKRSTSVTSNVTGVYNNLVRLEGTRTVTTDTRVTSNIYYKQLLADSFGVRYGVDYLSAPAVLWELTRLSFVVDRFIRIGDFLQSLRGRYNASRSVLGTVTSQKTVITETVLLKRIAYVSPSIQWRDVEAAYTVKTEHLDRKVNLALPKLPSVNWSDLNLQQQMDHIALIWQNLPKYDYRSAGKIAGAADRELGKLHFAEKRKLKFK